MLAKLRRARRTPARLLGVALTGIAEADSDAQLSLFEDESDPVESTRDRLVSRAVDAVRAKFGADAVLPARLTTPPGDRPRVRRR